MNKLRGIFGLVAVLFLFAAIACTGDLGPAGPQGAQGSAGVAGAQAEPGSAGVAGPQGAQGSAGVAGLQGDSSKQEQDSNREIAEELFVSVRTVERHITNIYTKTNARGRADAMAYALRHGLSSFS